MKSRKYWEWRTIALENELQQDALVTARQIIRLYSKAKQDIDDEVKEIRKMLRKLVGNLSDEELDKLLAASDREPSYQDLLNALANADNEKVKRAITARINAQAYGARISVRESVGNKILAIMTNVAKQESYLCRELFEGVYLTSFYSNIYTIAEGYNTGIAFDVLPRRSIDKALANQWSGAHFSDRIWRKSETLAQQVQDTIVSGLISGKSSAKMATELVVYTDRGSYAAQRLVRTETAHFLNQGQIDAYNEAGVKRYRFLASLSERTCSVCGHLDGKAFSVSDASEGNNYPPIHPNCRCTTITADVNLKTRNARNPQTGKNYKVNGNMNFEEWKESLTDDQKKAFNTHVKMYRNEASDKKQYARYKDRLGRANVPKTFDLFREMKYTDVKTWTELKGFYRYKGENARAEIKDYRCVNKLREMGVKGDIHIPPREIDTERLGFDNTHINQIRKHNVSEQEAKQYITDAAMSITKRNGLTENYYYKDGIAYVNPMENMIKTAFSSDEFKENVIKIMEVLRKYGY